MQRSIISVLLFASLIVWTNVSDAGETYQRNGQVKGEVAPSKDSCCANTEDRAKHAAEKECFPDKVKNIQIGSCNHYKNAAVDEFFDCTRTWQATCEKGEEEEKDPCAGLTCGGHGRCISLGGKAVCVCDTGYAPDSASGLNCVKP